MHASCQSTAWKQMIELAVASHYAGQAHSVHQLNSVRSNAACAGRTLPTDVCDALREAAQAHTAAKAALQATACAATEADCISLCPPTASPGPAAPVNAAVKSDPAGSTQDCCIKSAVEHTSEADVEASPQPAHEAEFERHVHSEVEPVVGAGNAANPEALSSACTRTGATEEETLHADAALQLGKLPDHMQRTCLTGDSEEAQGRSAAHSGTSNSRANAAEEDSLNKLDVLYEQQVKRIKAAAVELPEEAEVLVTDLIDHRQVASLLLDTPLYHSAVAQANVT